MLYFRSRALPEVNDPGYVLLEANVPEKLSDSILLLEREVR